MTAERIYQVSPTGYARMPKGTEGRQYIRRVCRDGAVTFLPVTITIQDDQEPASHDQQQPQEKETTNPPAEDRKVQPGTV